MSWYAMRLPRARKYTWNTKYTAMPVVRQLWLNLAAFSNRVRQTEGLSRFP